MNMTNTPNAFLLVSSHCPHCHALETLLRERAARGLLGGLEVVNVEQRPEIAQRNGVRSVPWLKLDSLVFDEAPTPAELDSWLAQIKAGGGESRYVTHLLERGRLANAIEWIEHGGVTLQSVAPLLADMEVKMNVRLGAGAILEHFENTPALRAIIPELLVLLDNRNPSIRTDACHYLSLTHSVEVVAPLTKMLDDEDQQVREVAGESIEALTHDTI